jgi:hypothetical protein
MKRVFILDKSGSMHTTIDDTIGGYNSFIEDQKSLGGTVTLVTFNETQTVVYKNTPIDSVPPLTRETYVPSGTTALYDVIGKVLTDYTHRPDTVIIMTDGIENASCIYTREAIKDLIHLNTEQGVLFMYLGANHDAFTESESIGIHGKNVLKYSETKSPAAFDAVSRCIRARSTGDETPISTYEY